MIFYQKVFDFIYKSVFYAAHKDVNRDITCYTVVLKLNSLKQEPISEEEIIRTIALFRLANPKAYLRFAGGRRRLSDTAIRLALRAGINSAIAGDLLTTKGTGIEKDKKLVESCGYQFETIA